MARGQDIAGSRPGVTVDLFLARGQSGWMLLGQGPRWNLVFVDRDQAGSMVPGQKPTTPMEQYLLNLGNTYPRVKKCLSIWVIGFRPGAMSPVWILVTSHCHRARLNKRDPAVLACLDRPVHKALVGAPVLSDSPQIVGARWHTLLGWQAHLKRVVCEA